MPGLNEVRDQFMSNQSPDWIRRDYLRALQEETDSDIVLYASDFRVSTPDISINNNDVQGFMSALHGLKGDKLDLILHSPGGSVNSAEQIVQYLRGKYNYIRAIIPQNAMSAATMIACASDEIIMGKASALGPTDPQVYLGGSFVAAQSILNEFEQGKREVQENPGVIPIWMPRIANWPPGLLDECNKALMLSRELVGKWLEKYMFREEGNAGEKAKKIANYLSDANEHKNHGRALGIEVLMKEGVKIQRLEDNQKLQEKVLSVFHAAMLTFQMTNCIKIIENHLGKGLFTQQAQLAK